jgi:hypothetical protein
MIMRDDARNVATTEGNQVRWRMQTMTAIAGNPYWILDRRPPGEG